MSATERASPGGDTLPIEVWRSVRAHAEDAWPRECCGLVFAGAQGALEVARGVNPATRADRFVLDPSLLLAAGLRAARGEGRLLGIYHSHPHGPARLSGADRDGALLAGQPAWPGVDLLVVSWRPDAVGEGRRFRWCARRLDFLPVEHWSDGSREHA